MSKAEDRLVEILEDLDRRLGNLEKLVIPLVHAAGVSVEPANRTDLMNEAN